VLALADALAGQLGGQQKQAGADDDIDVLGFPRDRGGFYQLAALASQLRLPESSDSLALPRLSGGEPRVY
jgi:hypothetical protein